MGNSKSLKLDPNCAVDPKVGKTCLKVEYEAKDGWSGVVWQNPPGDWGNVPGGWDVSGAKKLAFWARGKDGGEVVTFEFGILGKDKAFHDSAKGKLDKIALTKE